MFKENLENAQGSIRSRKLKKDRKVSGLKIKNEDKQLFTTCTHTKLKKD